MLVIPTTASSPCFHPHITPTPSTFNELHGPMFMSMFSCFCLCLCFYFLVTIVSILERGE
jgi:hypothetical protein